MAKTVSIMMVGDKEVIGALDTSFLAPGSKIYPGTLAVNGPVYMGLVPNIGIPQATVMIGPPIGIPASPPYSLQVDGISNYRSGVTNFYTLNNYYALCTKYAPTIRNSTSITNGVNTKNALNVANDNSQFNANLTVAGRVTIGGTLKVAGTISSPTISMLSARISSKKGFDIPHPSKDNHRLRHVCPEGPESAVYIRGILKDKNVIELPDYWKGLIDPESISVQLTAIGIQQDLYVGDTIDWGTKVEVKSGNGTSINCYYDIWANRIGEPLHVEYKGLTPRDYPGDNKEYNINGL